jgi:hypothetical protein
MYEVFSVCCIFTGCRLITASNAAASLTSVFTCLLAGDWLTTNSLLKLTNAQAGGHLLPNPNSFYCRNRSCSSSYSLGTDHTENTASNNSSIVACMYVAAIVYQRQLFTQSLRSNACCIAAYFAVVA